MHSRRKPIFPLIIALWLVSVAALFALTEDCMAAGGGSSSSGGSGSGSSGVSSAPPKKATPKRASGHHWWKSLNGKAYPLDDGSVLEFKFRGKGLVCEWGRLEYETSGVPRVGRLRMECVNCRHVYGIDLMFSSDLKNLTAHMGYMGRFSGRQGRATSQMRLAGPMGE